MQHGVIILDAPIPAGGSTTINVTFLKKFSVTPDIIADLIINSSDETVNKTSVHIGSRTASNCTIFVINGGASQIKPAIGWVAIGN